MNALRLRERREMHQDALRGTLGSVLLRSLLISVLALATDLATRGTAWVPASFPSAQADAQALVARSHEMMEYSVSYLGIPMGRARLFVGQVDPSVAAVFLQAQTSSMLSFLTVRQQLATYLDPATGLPRFASLDAVEGSYRHTDSVQFDRFANQATVREKGKYDRTYRVDVPPGTVDFMALVFKLRSLPLEPGMRHEFPVLSGRQVKTIVAEVVAREVISTSAGEFRTVKVQVPTGFTGKFSEKNPTSVWFSDDPRRIVVRIATDFAIGHATAGLVSYAPGAASASPP